MFDRNSRYLGIPIASYTRADGNNVLYVKRRMLPAYGAQSIIGTFLVRPGQRLDTIAASVYNDPTQFWRICDANDELDPFLLVHVGRRLRIARVTPQAALPAV